MNNISVNVKCGYCESEINLKEETNLEDIDNVGFLNIDFFEGTMTFICSNCSNCNIMHLNSNAQINKGRRLPKSTGF